MTVWKIIGVKKKKKKREKRSIFLSSERNERIFPDIDTGTK